LRCTFARSSRLSFAAVSSELLALETLGLEFVAGGNSNCMRVRQTSRRRQKSLNADAASARTSAMNKGKMRSV
jgi:hypothetical protein